MKRIAQARVGLYLSHGESEPFVVAKPSDYQIRFSAPADRRFPKIPTVSGSYVSDDNPTSIPVKTELLCQITDKNGQTVEAWKDRGARIVATNFPNATVTFEDDAKKFVIDPNTHPGVYTEFPQNSARVRLAVYYCSEDCKVPDWSRLMRKR